MLCDTFSSVDGVTNPVAWQILELFLPAQEMKKSFEYEPKNARLQVNALQK